MWSQSIVALLKHDTSNNHLLLLIDIKIRLNHGYLKKSINLNTLFNFTDLKIYKVFTALKHPLPIKACSINFTRFTLHRILRLKNT